MPVPASIHLENNDYRLVIDPSLGATILSAEWQHPDTGWLPLLAPLQDRLFKAGCFVMAPFVNRIADGAFSYGGQSHHISLNNPKEGMALHGFARDHVWQVAQQTDVAVDLVLDLSASPWHFRLTQRVELGAGGIRVSLAATNTGAETMPFGIGLHPWFPKPRGTVLRLAAEGAHARDARGLPLAARVDWPWLGKALDGAGWFDGCFTGWSPRQARIEWPDQGAALDLRADGALRHVHVYTPDGRDVLCVEPVSHLPDAINRPMLAADTQMHELAPGETLSGAMTLEALVMQSDQAKA